MAPADDDVGGEKSTFRWLDAVRYALAFVVTVLIVTVIAHAIVVVLRPEKLTLKVVGGFVQVENDTSALDPSPTLTFRFTVQAINPGGRARIYYTNIDAFLHGKNPTSTSPAMDFLFFDIRDMVVGQDLLDAIVQTYGDKETVPIPYLNMLYNGGSIPDAMLRLNGTLITEIYSGYNKTDDRPTIYCCSRLTVGGDSSEYTGTDVECTKDDPTCNTT